MTDKLSKKRRSANMRAVRSRNTAPEMRVRQVAHGLGYRFRLHRKDLPGKPDVAFICKQKAIFVHGCFWHQHKGCKRGSMPQTNTLFWKVKLARNVERDTEQLCRLKDGGWQTLVVWECETNDKTKLAKRLTRFLK